VFLYIERYRLTDTFAQNSHIPELFGQSVRQVYVKWKRIESCNFFIWDLSVRTGQSSTLLAFTLATEILFDGNLQIEMHCFASKYLSQR